jgi:hypothetical protein
VLSLEVSFVIFRAANIGFRIDLKPPIFYSGDFPTFAGLNFINRTPARGPY